MHKSLPRVAVLGAGPIGLEAALWARNLGWPVVVFERGRIGEHWHRWGHLRLFSPFGWNSTPEARRAILEKRPGHAFPKEDAATTGREHLLTYLDPLAEALGCVQQETQVLQVGRCDLLKEDAAGEARRARHPFRLLVREARGRERFEKADVVLDCTGTYGQHRWMGEGGIPALGEVAAAQQIAYGLEDILGEKKSFYANKTVLVVGSGYSAATTVCHLAELCSEASMTWVYWVARDNPTQPLRRVLDDPLKERDRLAARANALATRTDDNVEFHPMTVVEAVEFLGQERGFKVQVRSPEKTWTWEVDRIVANVGHTPDRSLFRELHVADCPHSFRPLPARDESGDEAGRDQGPTILHEPNFFILGAKSFGRSPGFLLREGFEQVRRVFAHLQRQTGSRARLAS